MESMPICVWKKRKYLAFCLVGDRHVGSVAFVARVPGALAIASIVVLALVHDYFSDELSASFLGPKRRTFWFRSFLLVIIVIACGNRLAQNYF